MPRKRLALAAILVFAAIVLAYSNHFENGFHFDDFHTVSNNPYIRSLHNAKLFFTDPATFSVLPANRTYRPLVTLSLAFDYWLGGGLNPFYFHLDAFIWFLAQLALMFFLFRHILRLALASPWTDWAGLFATALYGLHPVMAETVNYVIQRGDLYSTMLVILSLAIYALQPRLRKFGIYLVPLALALITKQPAAIFPAILFAYALLFEKKATPRTALLACLPSLGVVAAMLWLQTRMMPATFSPGLISAHDYIVTQPWVALHYFLMFFAPVALTADTDQTAFTTIFTPESMLGLVFLGALGFVVWRTSKRREWRPVSFGLAWFVLALIPTSVYRLAELENDHRMFFPFAGLALATGCCGLLLLKKRASVPVPLAVASAAILILCASGVYQRNRVWRDEETLWHDVTLKSPHNGRGLMNYGLTQMKVGRYQEALSYFQRALEFTPNYFILEINLGIVYGELHQNAEAKQHFSRALLLAPNDEQPPFYYGRWLMTLGLVNDAIPQFVASVARNRDFLDPRYALMQAYVDTGRPAEAKSLATDTLQISPGDPVALRYLSGQAAAEALPDQVAVAEANVGQAPSANNYLELSLAYHQAKRYRDCIRAAQEALRIKPDFPEAYNNIAAAYEDLHEWEAAIAAAREAVRLRPDFQLAKNNLAYSEEQKRLSEKK